MAIDRAMLRAMTVLIIDDDALMRGALQRWLSAETRTAANLQDGILEAQIWQPSIILLDLFFPGLDGTSIESIASLRAASPRAQVLVHSGSTSLDIQRSALQHGALAFILKGDVDALRAGILAARQRVESFFVCGPSVLH